MGGSKGRKRSHASSSTSGGGQQHQLEQHEGLVVSGVVEVPEVAVAGGAEEVARMLLGLAMDDRLLARLWPGWKAYL